jgi:hypothetical protein
MRHEWVLSVRNQPSNKADEPVIESSIHPTVNHHLWLPLSAMGNEHDGRGNMEFSV